MASPSVTLSHLYSSVLSSEDHTAVPFWKQKVHSVKGQQVGGDGQAYSSLSSALEHIAATLLHLAKTWVHILAPGLGH